MKQLFLTFLQSIAVALISFNAAAENYNYSTLIIKDYDEMRQMVDARLKKARGLSNENGEPGDGDGQAIEHLRDAYKLILSRPDSDNMIAKIAPDIRKALMGFNAYEDTLSSLAAESIATIKDKGATVSRQSTSLFILENMLREIRGEAETNKDLRAVVQRIEDANLKIPKDVINDRKVRSMFVTVNPSEEAEKILKDFSKKERNAEKAAKEKAKADEKAAKDKAKADSGK